MISPLGAPPQPGRLGRRARLQGPSSPDPIGEERVRPADGSKLGTGTSRDSLTPGASTSPPGLWSSGSPGRTSGPPASARTRCPAESRPYQARPRALAPPGLGGLERGLPTKLRRDRFEFRPRRAGRSELSAPRPAGSPLRRSCPSPGGSPLSSGRAPRARPRRSRRRGATR
jgi:hypothetical protein